MTILNYFFLLRSCPLHSVEENRQQLVNAGAIPILIGLLRSDDADVQYYCSTALSNIAVDGKKEIEFLFIYLYRQKKTPLKLFYLASNRKKLALADSYLIQYLIALMDTKSLKVQCQAALALRNLASDGMLLQKGKKKRKKKKKKIKIKIHIIHVEKYQVEIVQYNGLAPLLRLLKSSFLPLILSSVACVRNISIHPANESPIIQEGFVHPLIELLSFDENEEVQCHAISTLRNLAASSERNKRTIVEAGAVERIKQLIHKVPVSVRTEMTAAVAVLALSDELKPKLLAMNVLDVLIPATLEKKHVEVQGNAAAAIGNLSSKIKDYSPFVKVWDAGEMGLKAFLTTFLNDTSDIPFQHIGVWTIEQFLDGESKLFI
jgi:vacuolar protein 8